MSFEIRKIVTLIEETRIEGGKATDTPVTMAGVAVVGYRCTGSRQTFVRSATTSLSSPITYSSS